MRGSGCPEARNPLVGRLRAVVITRPVQEVAEQEHRVRPGLRVAGADRGLEHGPGAVIVAELVFQHAAEHHHRPRCPVRMAGGDGLLQDAAGGQVVTVGAVRIAQSGKCLRGNAGVRRGDRLLIVRQGTLVIFKDHPSVLGQADQGSGVLGTGGTPERRPRQFRLVPPQQVTEFSKGLAVTAIKLLPVMPGEHFGYRSRQAGICSQQIPDSGLQRVPGFPAARTAGHRRQRAGMPASASVRAKISRASSAAYGPAPGRAWAGVSQHLVAVCPGGLCD